MKTILIPTDFSATAGNAVDYAFALFGVNDIVFILLNTYLPVYAPPEVLITVEDVYGEKSRKQLSDEADRIKNTPAGQNAIIETASEFGGLLDITNKIIRERHVDYVVMGTRGATGMKELLIGSNAASAALNLRSPLLIIPHDARYKAIKEIVFAADYKHIDDPQVLVPMTRLARDNNSHVTIFNILDKGKITDADQAYEALKLKEYLGEIQKDYEFAEDDDKAHAIDNFLRDRQPDMFAVLRRKPGFFEGLFHKSITQEMAFHTHVPLLVLHE
jgi:nucleotide-binding universal stress UspA family protein